MHNSSNYLEKKCKIRQRVSIKIRQLVLGKKSNSKRNRVNNYKFRRMIWGKILRNSSNAFGKRIANSWNRSAEAEPWNSEWSLKKCENWRAIEEKIANFVKGSWKYVANFVNQSRKNIVNFVERYHIKCIL